MTLTKDSMPENLFCLTRLVIKDLYSMQKIYQTFKRMTTPPRDLDVWDAICSKREMVIYPTPVGIPKIDMSILLITQRSHFCISGSFLSFLTYHSGKQEDEKLNPKEKRIKRTDDYLEVLNELVRVIGLS